MASAMRVFRKLRASDGRIKIATLSGVSVLVAVIALLVGVLPVMADHESSAVDPGDPIQYGGGSGACDFVEVASAADNELHINNPASGTFTGPDGTDISITVTGNLFSFDVVTPGIAVYDVVVNGGPHNLHYDYDGNGEPVTSDVDLHAPKKNNGDLNNLSHINVCYDFDTQFDCGVTENREQDGVFTVAEVTIFANLLWPCEDKLGSFAVDNDIEDPDPDPSVLVDFGTGEGVVAGMATFTKDFGEGTPPFEPLEYSLTATSESVDVSWCDIRDEDPKDLVTINGDEGVNPFAYWLPDGKYPSLVGVTDDLNLADGALACKVYEEEDISGIQFTVVYFEFEDPLFR